MDRVVGALADEIQRRIAWCRTFVRLWRISLVVTRGPDARVRRSHRRLANRPRVAALAACVPPWLPVDTVRHAAGFLL